MIKKIKEDLYNCRWAIIILIIYFFLMQVIFKTMCPVRALFGISCPGCGLTHASIYVFTGRFHEAFHANYSVFLWWIFFIAFAFDRYVKPLKIKPLPWLLIIACSVSIFRYILIIFTK